MDEELPTQVAFNLDLTNICSHAIKNFGESHQVKKAIEELSELITELARSISTVRSHDSVIDEIADAQIMLCQLHLIFGYSRIQERIAEKSQRLADTIEYLHITRRITK